MSLCVPHVCAEDNVRFLRTGVTDYCEPPDVGARIQTWTL